MMATQPLAIIKPSARPKINVKSIDAQSPADPTKDKEVSVFTFSNETLPVNQITNPAHGELLSPTLTSGFFSPKSEVNTLKDEPEQTRTSLREQQLYPLRVEFDKTCRDRSKLIKSSSMESRQHD